MLIGRIWFPHLPGPVTAREGAWGSDGVPGVRAPQTGNGRDPTPRAEIRPRDPEDAPDVGVGGGGPGNARRPDLRPLLGSQVPCQVLAVLLHFFFLSAFAWMLVEGLHLYSLVIRVFGSEDSKLRYYYGVGWGRCRAGVGAHGLGEVRGWGR